MDGVNLTIREQVFETDNLARASISVGRAMKRSAPYKPFVTKKARDAMDRLLRHSRDVAKDVQDRYGSLEEYRFRRVVIGIPKGRSRQRYADRRKGVSGAPARPISLFDAEERVLFRAVLTTIWPHIEHIVVPTVCYCTYRKGGKLQRRDIAGAVTLLRDAKMREGVHLLESDIQGFFDNIDRFQLLETLSPLLDDSAMPLLEAIVNAETLLDPETMRDIDFNSQDGIPQGSALSPLLACAYLSPFDRRVEELGLKVIRYVDDFVVVCDSWEEAEKVRDQVRDLLWTEFKLRLKEGKTHIIGPGEEILFLGHRIDGQGRLTPSHKRCESLRQGIFERVCSLPKVPDKEIALALTSFVLGFWLSLKHCDFIEDDYRQVARLIKEALKTRGLEPNRLTRLLKKCSKKWPVPFMEELACG